MALSHAEFNVNVFIYVFIYMHLSNNSVLQKLVADVT